MNLSETTVKGQERSGPHDQDDVGNEQLSMVTQCSESSSSQSYVESSLAPLPFYVENEEELERCGFAPINSTKKTSLLKEKRRVRSASATELGSNPKKSTIMEIDDSSGNEEAFREQNNESWATKNEEYSDISDDDVGKDKMGNKDGEEMDARNKVKTHKNQGFKLENESFGSVEIIGESAQGQESDSDSGSINIDDMSQSQVQKAFRKLSKIIDDRNEEDEGSESNSESVYLELKKRPIKQSKKPFKKVKKDKSPFDLGKFIAKKGKAKEETASEQREPKINSGIQRKKELGSKSSIKIMDTASTSKEPQVKKMRKETMESKKSNRQQVLEESRLDMLRNLRSIEKSIKRLEKNPVKIRAVEVCPEIKKIPDPDKILAKRIAKWERVTTEVLMQSWIQEAISMMATIQHKYNLSIKPGSENLLEILHEIREEKKNKSVH